ncbi:hypothetical protein [Methylomonas koyamae]|uniref:hypothetical protein n=1 Tax=Methylomonas koyamae TaxID=702114 RepID=UPI000A992E04|nr:hypothetical protein [Methylomonas koyamae]BBL59065.1 hypothetical protein MKFW12EY_26780 [Methylomonas koyamae]
MNMLKTFFTFALFFNFSTAKADLNVRWNLTDVVFTDGSVATGYFDINMTTFPSNGVYLTGLNIHVSDWTSRAIVPDYDNILLGESKEIELLLHSSYVAGDGLTVNVGSILPTVMYQSYLGAPPKNIDRERETPIYISSGADGIFVLELIFPGVLSSSYHIAPVSLMPGSSEIFALYFSTWFDEKEHYVTLGSHFIQSGSLTPEYLDPIPTPPTAPAPVPIPSVVWLFAMGLWSIGFKQRRRVNETRVRLFC